MAEPLGPPVTIPAPPFLESPERREQFAHGAIHVAEITVLFGAIARIIPGIPGKVFAFAIAGVDKDPTSGKVGPSKGTLGNLLPQPVGYMKPAVYGLSPNFYLPSGSTNYIPRVADRLGLGLAEQRRLDAAENARLAINAATSRLNTARAAIVGLSNDALTELAFGQPTSLSVRRIIAGEPTTIEDLRVAALEQLAARNVRSSFLGDLVVVVPVVVVPAAPPVAAVVPIPMGSTQPEVFAPINDAALAIQAGATGIRKQLVSERADP